MIDLKAARANPDQFRAALVRRGAAEELDRLLEIDFEFRRLQQRIEELRAQRKPKGKPSSAEIARLTDAKRELQELEEQLGPLEEEKRRLLALIPNLPDPEAPDGWTDEDAVELRRVGVAPSLPSPKDALELGAPFGWIDVERGARVSGSRFVYRRGDAALLELSLYRWALDRLVQKGFEPVLPPVLVREEAMYGTGFLPTEESNLYRLDERDRLYLAGTSEVALAALHMGEILEDLPLRYAGFSTNFRREAGAAGKDTRGMFRVHQFDKVEMYVYTTPDDSREEHERLLAIEEELVGELGLPYRVVDVAAGDLGASAARKFDIEAWFPSQERYREITSCSNTTDYQANRMQIRFRPGGRGTASVHTLNGTAVTARAMLAVLENFQDEAGTVAVPECLVAHGAPLRLGSLAGSGVEQRA
ncbi:MAG: serine--tRNA ligase [Thermoleophilia bacterium]|nr:serine--tRNA ligase [Thermoleophilia bacterium]